MSSTRALTTTLLAATLLVYSAQGMLVPVMAPVTRIVGLQEVDLGAVMTLAAAMLVVGGPLWSRVLQRSGVRAVLVSGLVLAVIGSIGFAVMTQIAADHDLPRAVVLPVFVLTRGVIYGLGFAAVPVAAMTYLASVSDGVAERTRAMGAFGAAQGIALVLGPAIGGLLALGGLLLPIHVAPVLLAAILVVVWRLPAPAQVAAQEPSGLSFTDRRVLPYLLFGGVLFLGLSLVENILGFLLQDRLELSNTETAATVAVAGVLIGVGFAATQALVAPRLGWAPLQLMAVGGLLAALGYVAAVFAPSLATVLPSLMVIAAGLGLAVPGYNAGATLAVESHEHAAVAGLLTATAGLVYVAGPLTGTALYSMDPVAPIIGAALLSVFASTIALWPSSTPARS